MEARHFKTPLFVIIFLFALLPFVFAQYQAEVGESVLLYASFKNDTHPYPTHATFNILYPNSLTYLTFGNLSNISSLVWYYNFTPNETGNYFISIDFYSNNNNVLTEHFVLYVSEKDEKKMLTLLFGFIALIAALFWLGSHFLTKPLISPSDSKVNMLFQVKTLGAFLIFIGILLFITFSMFLEIVSANTDYAVIFSIIALYSVYFVWFVGALYIVFFVMYLIYGGFSFFDVRKMKQKK
jgi:hypothetical protein